jgi:OmcA/MtrC family decaheme c-type cytochrome
VGDHSCFGGSIVFRAKLFRRGFGIGYVLISVAVLAGCEGGDGARGPQGAPGPIGPPGPPAPVTIASAAAINAEISSVAIASPPVVRFELTDGDGRPIIGLTAGSISFMVAKLIPGTDGDASRWQSYLVGTETADGVAPDALSAAEQGVTENGAAGTLQDNNDGSYVYSFATDITSIPGVDYEPTLTHRVSFEIRGFVPVVNPVYTFRPSDLATTGIATRDIVSTGNCNRCHEQLSHHGGGRLETRTCVICHNPGSTDQDSGNTIDFKVLIHRIHDGANLPSVQAGGSYVIYGFGERAHDFSDVVWPQDIRNCTTCHFSGDPAAPQGDNWQSLPTSEACGSCHDDVDFVTGAGHGDANLAATNADCAICHTEGGLSGSVAESHALLAQRAAAAYEYRIINVAGTGPGEFPTVSFSVVDPQNANAPYDIQLDPAFTQGAGASRLAIDIGWQTRDYSNEGSGSATATSGTPAQPLSLNPLFGGATNTGNNVFTMTSPVALPLNVAGSGVVAIEGHPAADVDGDSVVDRIPVKTATSYFAITDMAATPRRNVVDIAKCDNCHQRLSMHGDNRTDNINVCVICHNPNATDINQRLLAGIDASNAIDGKDEEATDFKRMIHALHAGSSRAAGLVVYGFGGTPTEFGDVVFPGRLSNCETCHRANTYYPLGPDVQATTIDTGADLSTPFDDVNISPTAAACSACHDSSLAQVHMEQNGAGFDVVQGADGLLVSTSRGAITETCSVCHGPGRIADIKLMHGFE